MNTTVDFDMKLIELVRDRPALYDSRLPASERTKPLRDKYWNEIYLEFDGAYNLEKIRSRWKGLRDTFSRVKSGKHTTNWRYVQTMNFLDSFYLDRDTTTATTSLLTVKPLKPTTQVFINAADDGDSMNYEEEVTEYFDDTNFDITGNEYEDNETNMIKNEAQQITDEEEEVVSSVNADDDNNMVNGNTNASPVSEVAANKKPVKVINSLQNTDINDFDEVDHYCAALACSLRDLNVKDRLELQINFMQQIYDKVYK